MRLQPALGVASFFFTCFGLLNFLLDNEPFAWFLLWSGMTFLTFSAFVTIDEQKEKIKELEKSLIDKIPGLEVKNVDSETEEVNRRAVCR